MDTTEPLFQNLPAQHRKTEEWLLEVNPKLTGTARDVAELFATVCGALRTIPNGTQRDVGMQKLLEAKDAFVRSVVP